MRIEFEWVLRNDHSRYLGECEELYRMKREGFEFRGEDKIKDRAIIYVYLDRNWRKARRKAKIKHATPMEYFVRELVDTVNHEVVHAFFPEMPARAWRREERAASKFARYSREAMR